jgi:hypothetical protein
MDHPDNTLNNITSIFAWKPIKYLFASVLLIGRGRLFYQESLSKFKKLGVSSDPKVENSFSLLGRGPITYLELRKNHPLFVDYRFRF